MIRIVFSDVDGTLLNKERQLSVATRLEIARLASKNIPFVLASSRMPKAMRPFLEECGVTFPMIAYNGALVLSSRRPDGTEPLVYSKTIPFPVLFAAAAFWAESPIHMSIFRNDEWFTEDEDQWMEREINNTKVRPSVLPMATLVEMWQLRQMGPHKMMFMGEEEELTILQVLLEDNFAGQIQTYRPKPTYLELSPGGVSKDMGAELVCLEYGIDLRVAAAFGNQVNDVELLQKAAYSVAVANAHESAKRAARYITAASTDDGVAKMLQQWIR